MKKMIRCVPNHHPSFEDNIALMKEDLLSVHWDYEGSITKGLEFYNANLLFESLKQYGGLYKKILYKLKKENAHMKNFYKSEISSVNSANFQSKFDEIQDETKEYHIQFIYLISKFHVYRNITDDVFKKVLLKSPYLLKYILTERKLLVRYNLVIADVLTKVPEGMHYLVEYYSSRKSKRNLPKNLTNERKLQMIMNYVQSSSAELSVLQGVFAINGSRGFDLSDKVRWQVYNKMKMLSMESHTSKIQFFEFELSRTNGTGNLFELNVDEKVFPTTVSIKLNVSDLEQSNHVSDLVDYIPEMIGFDKYRRSKLWTNENYDIPTISVLRGKSKDRYNPNIMFQFTNLSAISRVLLLDQYLIQEKKYPLERVLVEMVHDISEKYHIDGLSFAPCSTCETYLSRLNNLLPALEGLCKQISMFREIKEINQEYFSIAKQLKSVEMVSSVEVKNVYADEDNEEVAKVMNLLFKPHFLLLKTDMEGCECLFDLTLKKELIKKSLFVDCFAQDIELLLKWGVIETSTRSFIKFNMTRVAILKQLYDYGYIMPRIFEPCIIDEIDTMLESGVLISDNKVLSPQEINYVHYMLNNKSYIDGPAIRNKYQHGVGNVQEEKVQMKLYQVILVAALIIQKLANDFGLSEAGGVRRNRW